MDCRPRQPPDLHRARAVELNGRRPAAGGGRQGEIYAALRTIRRTVEETRKAVPSLDDIRARFQANAEEARRASRESGNGEPAARTNEDITLRPVERRIPEVLDDDAIEAAAGFASRVRQILDTLYDANPYGLSGNEDCGQMSAWYVFSALGFYPVCPALPAYAIGSPLFAEAEIDVGELYRFWAGQRGARMPEDKEAARRAG